MIRMISTLLVGIAGMVSAGEMFGTIGLLSTWLMICILRDING